MPNSEINIPHLWMDTASDLSASVQNKHVVAAAQQALSVELRLDLIILEVFFSLKDSMRLRLETPSFSVSAELTFAGKEKH